MRYRDAGVDIPRADALKSALGPLVRATWTPGVRRLEGGFAGVMAWPSESPTAPLMLAATLDGVGTKLLVALEAGRVGDAAADLVYHGANDLLVHGARPLALLDYIAQERLDPDVVLSVVEGLSRACREVGAALLGGETAEMPDTYRPGVVDVAGCMIGGVRPETLLDGQAIQAGDLVLGLASDGLHTNGFSLARRVLAASGLRPDDPLPGGTGETIVQALLAPHRWYGRALLPELERGATGGSRIRALAHVTGGGIAGNLARVLPAGTRARIRQRSMPVHPLFEWIIGAGQVPFEDAQSALNMGAGMIVVTPAELAAALAADLERAGEQVTTIGEIVNGERGVEWVNG